MKLKRLGTLLLTAIIAATTLAGCGAMPSTGNGNETGENASVIAATEEDTASEVEEAAVEEAGATDLLRKERSFIRSSKKHTLILKLNILCLQ